MNEKEIINWKEWNSQGFIPGEEETESEFAERVAFCLKLEEHLFQTDSIPFDKPDSESSKILEEAIPLTEELYGIAPRWVPLFFNNHQLLPWHGGCAWIFQLDEKTPTAAFLQLRANFRHSPTYLGLYKRKELLAHELAHVGRMLYQEPQFEELLAYRSSLSPFRRWLGPILQSSKETLLFILSLGLVIIADFASLSAGPQMEHVSWWIKSIPLLLLLLALIRLTYRHRQFNQCLKYLKALYPSKIANHLIYRLTDAEIKQFSRSSPEQIQTYMTSVDSFRWKFLSSLYKWD